MKLFQLIALLAFLILGTTMSYAADVKNEVDGSASLEPSAIQPNDSAPVGRCILEGAGSTTCVTETQEGCQGFGVWLEGSCPPFGSEFPSE
jgi:hypothetical protein